MATTVVPCVTWSGGSLPPPPPCTGASPTRLSNSLKLGPGSPAPGNKGRLIRRETLPATHDYDADAPRTAISCFERRWMAHRSVAVIPVSRARRPRARALRHEFQPLRVAVFRRLTERSQPFRPFKPREPLHNLVRSDLVHLYGRD